MKKSICGMIRVLAVAALLVLGAASGAQASQCLEPDQEAEPVHQTPPAYPHAASMMCIEGEVLLELTVGEKGLVDAAKVLESEPPGIFDGAARRAVDDWYYLPECADGRPGTSTLRTYIDFELESLEDCPDEPIQLEKRTLTLMGEIGALYALASESQLGGPSIDQLEESLIHAAEPALDRDARQVWRYHHDLLLDSIDTAQTTQRRLQALGFPHLLFVRETYKADPDLTQTQSALGTMREALDAHVRRLVAIQQEIQARHEALARQTDFDQQTLALLTHAFAGDHDRAMLDEHISELEKQFQLISDIVDLFVREQGRWPEHRSGDDFDDPQVGNTFDQLIAELSKRVGESRQSQLSVLRGFEDYSLSD